MNNQILADKQISWTWADQISTYRFWGIFLFYFWSGISLGVLTMYLSVFLSSSLDMRIQQAGIFYSVIGISGLFGLYLGWAASRHKAKAWLIALGILQLVGGLLATIPSLAAVLTLQMLGAVLLGLGTGAIALAVPIILANGRGGGETFAIAFGVMYTCAQIGRMQAAVIGGVLMQDFGDMALPTTVAVYVVLGLLFLLPINPALFQEAPPQRGYSLTPEHRGPFVTAISCLIPFYWLYWLYRAHGEVASVAPSRSLLSPRASWLASIFVPLLYPVIVTSLMDALNSRAAGLGRASYRRPWVIFLWAFVFPPVAMALVQSAMNKAMVELTG